MSSTEVFTGTIAGIDPSILDALRAQAAAFGPAAHGGKGSAANLARLAEQSGQQELIVRRLAQSPTNLPKA